MENQEEKKLQSMKTYFVVSVCDKALIRIYFS